MVGSLDQEEAHLSLIALPDIFSTRTFHRSVQFSSLDLLCAYPRLSVITPLRLRGYLACRTCLSVIGSFGASFEYGRRVALFSIPGLCFSSQLSLGVFSYFALVVFFLFIRVRPCVTVVWFVWPNLSDVSRFLFRFDLGRSAFLTCSALIVVAYAIPAMISRYDVETL